MAADRPAAEGGAWPDTPIPAGAEAHALCDALLAQARKQMAAGAAQPARETYRRAAELAIGFGDPEDLARAALGVRVGQTVGIADAFEMRLIEEALDGLADAGGPLHTQLLARLARALHCTASYELRRHLGERAVAAARSLRDPATLAAVLADHCSVIATHEPVSTVLPACDEAIRLATRLGEHGAALDGRWIRIGCLLDAGAMDSVRTEVQIAGEIAAALRRPDHEWMAPMVRATLAVLAARLDDALELAGEGLRLGRLAAEPAIDARHGTIVMLVRYLQGRLAELEPALRSLIAAGPAPEWRCVLALVLHHGGQTDEAHREFALLAADDFATIIRDTPRHSLLALLAVACDAMSDARRAAILSPLLEAHAGSYLCLSQSGVGCLGAAPHYLGLLACARRRWAEAAEHFERAIEMNGRIGAPALVANSRLQCARALMRQGGDAGRARAAGHLRLAREAEKALGLGLWLGGASAADLSDIGGGPADSAAGPPLSRREAEVAELIAAGLGNQEIADRLFISKRTVETHVDHVRQKLAVSSRAAIVAWVVGRRTS